MNAPSESLSSVAARLQQEMKRRDWTFRQLAEQLDVPLSQAHAWAKGTHEPSLENLRHIAKKLRIKIAEFVA